MKLNLDEREPVVDQCSECSKVTKEGLCEAFLSPKAKWDRGKKCPLATHLRKKLAVEEGGKKRVGQQKHKKKRR